MHFSNTEIFFQINFDCIIKSLYFAVTVAHPVTYCDKVGTEMFRGLG